MTKDNWLTVAMVIAVIMTAIATLLAPVLAVYVESRINQPKPTPTTSQPTSRLRRLILEIRSRWIVFTLLAVGLTIASFGVRRSRLIVDKWTIVLIAAGCSIYFSQAAWYQSSRYTRRVADYFYKEIQELKNDRDKTDEGSAS